MRVKINPKPLSGTMTAPPSKSMAHRLLICSGLSKGTSIVHGIAPSEDVLATLDCLKAIGADYSYNKDTVTITGADLKGKEYELYCRESGSTLRFFIPICLINEASASLFGSSKLLSRPLEIYENICNKQNIEYNNDGTQIKLNGRLKSGDYKVPGNISSQFISGLLFALPLLDGDSTINIVPPIESCSYIKLTIQALQEFGIKAEWTDERTLFIKGNQEYQPKEVWVEGDYSNAAFFDALNYMDSDVTVEGLKSDSIQGDRVYKTYFEMMKKGTPTVHLSDCPDLGPVFMAVASAHNGGIFTGTKRLKIKESDRGTAMAQELGKLGISVNVEDDTIVVYPTDFHKPDSVICGHNDHRIVMSMAVLLTKTGGEIEGADAVKKSMPDFFDQLKQLGAEVEIYND